MVEISKTPKLLNEIKEQDKEVVDLLKKKIKMDEDRHTVEDKRHKFGNILSLASFSVVMLQVALIVIGMAKHPEETRMFLNTLFSMVGL